LAAINLIRSYISRLSGGLLARVKLQLRHVGLVYMMNWCLLS